MPTLEDQKKVKLDRELILESIFKKWNPIALGCKAEHGPADCPLCKEYWDSDGFPDVTCYGCPIRERTSQHACEMTPYAHLDSGEIIEEQYDIIEAEIEFLISLLSVEDQGNIENLHKEWTKEQKRTLYATRILSLLKKS